jgi:hypothetical protein
MRWERSWRADPRARDLADRHYNRQKVGAAQFVPPGRCLVLVIPKCAFWVTSWPFGDYVKHEWAGAMVCSAFRNERPDMFLSSELILEAVAASRAEWPNAPLIDMITFVNGDKVRRKRDLGRCYRKAGFKHVGETKAGLIALQLLPIQMPSPMAPLPERWYDVLGSPDTWSNPPVARVATP